MKNFKSIKELEIDCRRVNLFIGEPNTGKSNILEVLGLLCWISHRATSLKEYVRFQYMENLFYDNSVDEPIRIVVVKEPGLSASPQSQEDGVVGMQMVLRGEIFDFDTSFDNSILGGVSVDHSGEVLQGRGTPERELEFIKLYRFEKGSDFQGQELSSLMPPHGSNMFAVVMGHRKLRASMARFFKDYGFELVLRPHEKSFEFQKRIEDEDMDSIFIYPYMLASDTLQRVIFYTIAIESNKNSTLVFEEPESHAFPYYTKYLGEKIAFDESNQYFIATHNPYLLLSILEKTPKDDVSVFITYFRDYQTKVKRLSDGEVSELMDYDPFFNLHSFIEDEEEER